MFRCLLIVYTLESRIKCETFLQRSGDAHRMMTVPGCWLVQCCRACRSRGLDCSRTPTSQSRNRRRTRRRCSTYSTTTTRRRNRVKSPSSCASRSSTRREVSWRTFLWNTNRNRWSCNLNVKWCWIRKEEMFAVSCFFSLVIMVRYWCATQWCSG